MGRIPSPETPASRPSFGSLIPGRRELRGAIALALPVVAVQLGTMAMGVVDTIMVGHFSATDLAAVALGNLYFFSAVVFPMGVLMALDPVVSQAVGAGDAPAVARGLQRGGVLALFLSLPASLILLPGRPILTLFQQPAEVVPVAAGYAHAAMAGVFPFLGFVVLRQTLQAMGRVGPIVLTIALANLANFAFNWVLIFGKMGFPALGAVGSGWASSVSRTLMLLGLLVLAWPLLRPHLLPFRRESFRLLPLRRMVRLGSPIGIQMALEFGAFGTIGIFMGWLGTVAMAGHQVAMTMASFSFMVPLGVSQAASVLVGREVGRESAEGARKAAGASLVLGAAFMASTALVFLSVPSLLANAFSSEAEVVAVAVLLIPLAGVFQVFDGLQVVASGILRGVGDTRSPMVVNLMGFWFLGIPVSLWFGFATPMGPAGLWWGLVVGLGSVSLFLLFMVRLRLGRELRRIVIDG